MARVVLNAVLSEIRELTSSVRELTLRFTGAPLAFQAGQFVTLHVPQAGSEKKVKRAYSIASTDRNNDSVKLVIKLVPGGIASTYIGALHAGAEIELSGPFGKLFFLTPPEEKVFFFCTGAGISQHYSYLTSQALDYPDRRYQMLLGVWNENEVFYRQELETLKTRLPHFNYEYVLDRAAAEWQGKTGHVTDYLDSLDFTGENASFYLCGNPAMIDAMKAALAARNFPKERIIAEAFR